MTRPDVQQKIRRVEAEIAAGRKWRAKEMLQGSFASRQYALEPELLEAYGKLLDSLGDRFEAGKYLFLSGARSPEYEDAIFVFLHRMRNTHVNDLIAQFPISIQQNGLGHLPEIVREELEQRGASPEMLERKHPLPPDGAAPPWLDRLIVGGCLTTGLTGLLLAFIGLHTVVQWWQG